MLGAIIGDIAGSRFEWYNTKKKDFQFFHDACRFTDDTVLSLAIGQSVLEAENNPAALGPAAVTNMQMLGCLFPQAGYGRHFIRWLTSLNPQPYNSFGNGAAMRVSACGTAARSAEEAKAMSRAVTEVTHSHPEGLKGAEVVAVAVFMARNGASKEDIRAVTVHDYYPLDFTLNGIRDSYEFDVTCQGSVPQAFEAFFESTDFEDSIRNAVSIGGDSDTIAAIAGSIAEEFYGIPSAIRAQAVGRLPNTLLDILMAFEERYPPKIAD